MSLSSLTEVTATPSASHWAGRRVLVTGHTGFKGSWLVHWLNRLGAEVHGLALDPSPGGHFELSKTASLLASDTRCDIGDAQAVAQALRNTRPDVVLHMAAQALVRASYNDPLGTLITNTLGTAHLLEACRDIEELRAIVVITTDKCYRNEGQIWPYRESDPLGGADPYSVSKACAELVSACYAQSFFSQQSGPRIATARAGNVIGGGDICKDRLLPDIFRAWDGGTPLAIRHPKAVRPWQHVLDALSGYLVLAQTLADATRPVRPSYNFGPIGHASWSVERVIEVAAQAWGTPVQVHLADTDSARPEAHALRLDTSLAASDLRWSCQLHTEQAVQWTVEWEKSVRRGVSAEEATTQQIERFLSIKELNP